MREQVRLANKASPAAVRRIGLRPSYMKNTTIGQARAGNSGG